MRGYAFSEKNQGFIQVRQLKNTLVNVRHDGAQRKSIFFWGASSPSAELVVRQFVYDRYGGSALNRALYESWGSRKPIALAMPASWRDHLVAHSWQVNRLASACAWAIAVASRMAHGVLFALRLVMALLLDARTANAPPKAHVVFESLAPANLPLQHTVRSSYDICTWYAQWSGKPPGVKAICHNIPGIAERRAAGLPVLYRPPVHLLAASKLNALRLAAWTLGATMMAGFNLLFGRWGYALMLAEAAKARSVRLCAPEELAQEYLFHSSGTIYRPMWTYDVQRGGTEVSLYFYSTYDQPKLRQGYEAQNFEWGPANWPRYIVWDKWQEEILKRDLGSGIKVAYSGPVYFSDNDQALPPLAGKPVAVFDIQPHRPAAHFGVSTLADCLAQHPDYYQRFLEDVADALGACGGNMVLKGKRDIGSRGHRGYVQLLKKLSSLPHVQLVSSEISALRVVSCSCAGISVPFTSTAIYLRDLNLPCAYYDPYGWMQLDDRSARGIPILQGKEQLQAWLKKVLSGQ